MKCSICGYRADCPCEFDGGICWTCKYGGKRIDNRVVDNYCNQDLTILQKIKTQLLLRPKDKLTDYQISVVNSQIKQFNVNPCRFKRIIDNILVN